MLGTDCGYWYPEAAVTIYDQMTLMLKVEDTFDAKKYPNKNQTLPYVVLTPDDV